MDFLLLVKFWARELFFPHPQSICFLDSFTVNRKQYSLPIYYFRALDTHTSRILFSVRHASCCMYCNQPAACRLRLDFVSYATARSVSMRFVLCALRAILCAFTLIALEVVIL